ncbi:hypothetical protein CFC21_001461 [Triticum aestivum]|uniref:SHSP domain-containing protein n=3 Tax=Triticum TaxID=4564 RepID=A0A3B5XXN5_WHEAT|nr:inactive protein RESTRICTED TEV MOVEMENT 2-like [Triticum aestivum]XP_048573995.1 inactive protein RESTRICTED TEV MOVEMENT 2-like isoform X2 [Triticum urartu]XP_048574001.1 inactive protein RESTRICTED TEV MOVEMENT 2-like isoform X2 [Triticum urartu]KAF6983212.1 hypothetical protein CFC21_001461 [Triticum aestivum]
MAAPAAAPGRAYEDFVPPHNMVTEPATHTLSVDLTAAGYKKEHIRVQLVRSHGLVVVRGERAVAGNRWSRFRLEFRVPDGCDLKGIHARFEGGVVRVTMPGLRTGPAAAVGDVSGKQVPPAAKADASGVRAGDKEDENVQKQPVEERGADAVKDSGRLDQGQGTPADGVQGVEAPAPASGRGYSYLPERRKLVTSVVGAVLVLFSLGIYVRYSFGP